jgi:hypothetical protein
MAAVAVRLILDERARCQRDPPPRWRAGPRADAAVIAHVIDAWPLLLPLLIGVLAVLVIAVRQAR